MTPTLTNLTIRAALQDRHEAFDRELEHRRAAREVDGNPDNAAGHPTGATQAEGPSIAMDELKRLLGGPEEESGRGSSPTGAALEGPRGGTVSPPRGEEAQCEPGEREVRTISNGVSRHPVPPQFGGTIVSGTPRRRGVGGIPSQLYGDEGDLGD